MSESMIFSDDKYFSIRTPLLPFSAFQEWSRGVKSFSVSDSELEQSIEMDERLLRARLQEITENPIIKEAFFIASPTLIDALPQWYEDPKTSKGRRVERSVVKYFSRICGRPTPFGLFAGCSLGQVGSQTRIITSNDEPYTRHTRPDMNYICNLVSSLNVESDLLPYIHYTTNTSLIHIDGRIHYCESYQKERRRNYRLVAVERTPILDKILTKAAKGASFKDLLLCINDAEITEEEAESFILELINSQLLMSSLEPVITGEEPLDKLIEFLALQLNGKAKFIADKLTLLKSHLISMDTMGIGVPINKYKEIINTLQSLPVKVDVKSLFQVDLVKKTTQAELSLEIIKEIQVMINILWRLQRKPIDPLLEFKKKFKDRYQDQEISLIEALDKSIGIEFNINSYGNSTQQSPFVENTMLKEIKLNSINWGTWETWLCQQLIERRNSGKSVIKLTKDELMPFLNNNIDNIPDSFYAMLSIVSNIKKEDDSTGCKIDFIGGAGPTGVNLLTRFCHSDPNIAKYVRESIIKEESKRPDAIYAEIVHLPEDRLGNVVLRPILREYEIPLLGRSGVDADHQIQPSDILISIKNDRIILRSKRLQKEIIPRHTNAHNYLGRGHDIYRFLCILQSQGLLERFTWPWGPLTDLPFLPRVEIDQMVLSKARWTVVDKEISQIVEAKSIDRIKGLRDWMVKRGLPRVVTLVDGDNKLPIDLFNILSVEAFLDLVKDRSQFILEEFIWAMEDFNPNALEAGFVNEIVIPFHSCREIKNDSLNKQSYYNSSNQSFPPGSEWLFLKIYTAQANADRLILKPMADFIKVACERDYIDKWFFIRYRDPDHHLRFRLHGAPNKLGELVPALLNDYLKPYIENGIVSKIMIDTYMPEYSRYGGNAGLQFCEDIFCSDSEIVMTLLNQFSGNEYKQSRWKLALLSTHWMLRDFGYNIKKCFELMKSIRDAYYIEFSISDDVAHSIGKKFRQERKELELLLWQCNTTDYRIAELIFQTRSEKYFSPISKLSDLCAEPSGPSLDSILKSLIHMSSNRILRGEQRYNEFIIAEFLMRAYEIKIIREGCPLPKPHLSR